MAEENTAKDIRSAIKFRSASKQSTPGAEDSTFRTFSLNDYVWTDKYQINGSNDLHVNDSIPKLILTEIQPRKKPDWAKVISSVQSIGRIKVLSELIETGLSGGSVISQHIGAAALNKLSDDYSASVSASQDLLDISDIEKLIDGPKVARYEIPFFSDVYLKSSTKDGWSIGSAIDNAGQLTDIINDGFQLNILKSPQWQNNSNDGMDWEVEFYLLNKDLDSLWNNFQFIHSIFPGTQWIRMKADSFTNFISDGSDKIAEKIPETFKDLISPVTSAVDKFGSTVEIDKFLAFTKSPNVFRVECPGRFLQLFVALDIEVSYVGNVRRMPLYTKILDGNISAVNQNSLYPDAYKIRLSARDLTPNCFNVYANYLMTNSIVSTENRIENSIYSTQNINIA